MRLFLPIFTLFYSFLLFAGPTFDTATVETALKLPYLSSGQSLYLNGTTVSSQVTNSPLVLSNGTLSIPAATSGADGYLASADWTTFNNKQATVSASSPLSISANNVTIQVANGSQNGYLSSTDWTSFNSKQGALIFSSPLSLSGTTASIQVATSGQNGYLSSSDWSTFNNKQNPLIFSSPLSLSGTTASIQVATSGQNGYLSSTDWSTFNSKQAALAFSSPLSLSGTTASVIYLAPLTTTGGSLSIPVATSSVDGYLAQGDWSTFNNKQATIGVTSPITLTSGTLVGIPVATSGVNGYLSSTDWSTFNNKQATISVSAPILLSGASLSIGTIAIANGGTGQTTAANAINALLPSQTGNNGKFLTTDGSVASWGTTGTGGGAGSVTSIASGAGITNNPATITSVGTVALSPGLKGRIISSDGTTATDQSAGTFGQQLVANTNTTTGLEYRSPLYKNYVTNPSCGTLGVTGITVTTGTIAQNTSSPLDSLSDCAISATASGGKYCWAVNTFDNALTAISQNCEAKFNYTGTATAFKAYVSIGGTTQTASLKGTLDSSGIYDLNFPCASGTALMCVEATAATSAIKVANVYVGPQTNIGSVSTETDWVAYTPTYTNFGTVSNNSAYWRRIGDSIEISGFVTTGTMVGTVCSITLPTGIAIDTAKIGTNNTTSNPGIVVGTYDTSNAGSGKMGSAILAPATSATLLYFGAAGAVASSHLTPATGTNVSDNAVGFSFRAKFPVLGWSSASNAVRSDQTNYDWTAYTPTLGAGFGAATNISFLHKRQGSNLLVKGSFTVGTASGSAATISLPGSLIIDSSKISIANSSANPGEKVGDWDNAEALSDTNGYIVTATGTSTSLVYFGNSSRNGSSTLTPAVGTSVTGSSVVMSVNFTVPISGWSETQNAPVLINSITTKSNTAKVFSVVEFNNSGSCSVASDPEGMIASVSDPGAGLCGVTLTTGFFTAAPKCWCNATLKPLVAAYQCETQFGGSATAGTTYTATSGGADSDQPFTLFCLGQRN
jgi:hypothetical protein